MTRMGLSSFTSTPPLVSVVIGTFNRRELVREAVRSVLAQTQARFELIVVDHGSTDGTADALAAVGDPRVRVVRIPNNGIIATPRNTGIASARAPLVAFLDSDDRWRPRKLEVVLERFARESSVGLVCHAEVLCLEDRPVRTLRYGPARSNMTRDLIANGNCLSTSAVVMRSELLRELGGFSERPEFITSEDYELWIRAASRTRFAFVDDVLGEYVMHGTNNSTTIERHLRSQEAVVRAHLDRLNDGVLTRQALGRLAYGRARALHSDGRFMASLPFYGHAIRQRPGILVRNVASALWPGPSLHQQPR